MTYTSNARDKILKTADRLFYRNGYRAVGVDAIIAESGVAKMTFYRHFPSKDDLIVAFLEGRNARYFDWIDGTIQRHEPRAALEAIFDDLVRVTANSRCQGCGFLRAAGEYPDRAHPAHRLALQHKRSTITRLRRVAEAAGAREARELAEGLMLLMDGAWSAARVAGPSGHARQVARAARRLIASHVD